MPSRLIDFDALWNSDKIAKLPVENRVDYLWMYGLADANGSFELNLHGIVGKISAIRPELTVERVRKCLKLFEKWGLLFTWQYQNKQYCHWTGSERKGRLPPKSQRHKFRRDAPPVPIEGKNGLRAYYARYGMELDLDPDPDNGEIISSTGLGIGIGVGLGVGIGSGKGKGLGFGVGVGAAAQNPAPQPQAQKLDLPLSDAIQKPGVSWTCPDCMGSFPESLYMTHKCSIDRTIRDRAAQLLLIARKKPGEKP
jgi:hypothetical protein